MLDRTKWIGLEKAFQVAEATEWMGDIRVNFHTAMKAAIVLSKYAKELEARNERQKRHIKELTSQLIARS